MPVFCFIFYSLIFVSSFVHDHESPSAFVHSQLNQPMQRSGQRNSYNHTIGIRTRHRTDIFFDVSPKTASRALDPDVLFHAQGRHILSGFLPSRPLFSMLGPMSGSGKSPMVCIFNWVGVNICELHHFCNFTQPFNIKYHSIQA